MQWELIDCGKNRYSIKNDRFQNFIGCSRSTHPDGEIIQSSVDRVLWVIEDGPGDQYRYGNNTVVIVKSMLTRRSIRHLSKDVYWSLSDEDDRTPVSTRFRFTYFELELGGRY